VFVAGYALSDSGAATVLWRYPKHGEVGVPISAWSLAQEGAITIALQVRAAHRTLTRRHSLAAGGSRCKSNGTLSLGLLYTSLLVSMSR
jgi:hypothetical protein